MLFPGAWDPTVRFLAEIPAQMNPKEITAVVITSLLLSLAATLYPSWRAPGSIRCRPSATADGPHPMSESSQTTGDQPVPALFFSRVERRYPQAEGALEILRGADLAIWPGELVALVAPSGAGKSTLLHLAGLLERPDGGEIFIGGHPTAAMADAERTRLRREEMGFVYQFHHLLPEFSALENVVMPQLIRGLKVRRRRPAPRNS